MSGARKKSAAAIVRVPRRAERTWKQASSAVRATGSSAAGIGVGDRAADRPAVADRRVGDVAHGLGQQRPAARDDAPSARASPAGSARRCAARRPSGARRRARAMPLRSTIVSGRARRKFSSGTSDWPPASAFASSPSTAERGGDRVRRDVRERGRLHARRRRSQAAPASPAATPTPTARRARRRAAAARPGRRRARRARPGRRERRELASSSALGRRRPGVADEQRVALQRDRARPARVGRASSVTVTPPQPSRRRAWPCRPARRRVLVDVDETPRAGVLRAVRRAAGRAGPGPADERRPVDPDGAPHPHRASSRSARQSFSAVNGGSTRRPPSASATALASAGSEPVAPPSPAPLAPSGFSGEGVSTSSRRSGGISAEVGRP